MADIIDLSSKLNSKMKDQEEEIITTLVSLGQSIDCLNLDCIHKGIDIPSISGIMADRLGELAKHYDGDKEVMFEFLVSIIEEKLFKGV